MLGVKTKAELLLCRIGADRVKWYADNSELNGIKGAEIPDILLFGGLIVDHDTEQHIKSEVEEIKKRHAHPRAPIKWNMKDLRELYKKQDMLPLYEKLMSTSRQWRSEIFEALSSTNCVLLVACIEGYSSKRTVLKERKDELSRYIFTNGLMRFGLHVRDSKPDAAQVVLDWPDKGISQPFDSEYASAYSHGRTTDRHVTYQCGKLNGLHFADSVLFTNMPHNTMLQVADLIVGATREFIECCIGKKPGGQGLDCLKLVRTQIRGAPDNVVGRGLVVPSGNTQFLGAVRKGVKGLLYAA